MDSRYWFLDTLSLVSLGRGGRYPWWFLIVVAVYAVAEMFRHRHEAGGLGVAECLARQQFFGDEVEQRGQVRPCGEGGFKVAHYPPR